MQVVYQPQQMQQQALAARRQGKTIAFVPTMGYLHEGHLSLCREARQRGDLLVLSIFVNPTQFGEGEDYAVYPRDLDRDRQLARSTGVDLLFTTDADAMYPPHYATYVEVNGLTDVLCGAQRPGHFRGVTTVVSKLFHLVQPDVALFGRKDFQQLAVIQRMTQDLNFPVEIVGLPIVREDDGLAMSSRNVRLTADHRQQALALVDCLRRCSAAARAGQTSAAVLLQQAVARLGEAPDAAIDYVEIRHQQTLEPMETITTDSVMLMAVRFGPVRLIDNHRLLEELST